MIRIHVSSVLTIKDAFLGQELKRNEIYFVLDKYPCYPEQRPGGNYILTNLAPGSHSLTISGVNFEDENLEIIATDNGFEEYIVNMRPNGSYRFGTRVRSVEFAFVEKASKMPLPGIEVCLTRPGMAEMKIAQDIVPEGAVEMRVYFRGNQNRLKLPAQFLISDGEGAEVCVLRDLENDIGRLGKPLRMAHMRGRTLTGCQVFRTDEKGVVKLYYSALQPIEVLVESKGHFAKIDVDDDNDRYIVEIDSH